MMSRLVSDSEVRTIARHTRLRTSKSKGTLASYDSSAVFGFEVPTQTRGYNDRNFKSTALGGHWLAPKPMTEHHRRERSCKLGNDEGRHSGGCYPRKGVGKRPGNGDRRIGEGR